MGISYVMVDWLARLGERGAFADRRSILELGPQDLYEIRPRDVAEFIARAGGGAPALMDVETRFFDRGEARRWTAVRDFYAVLGLTDYHAADLDDPRADYVVDLNRPTALDRRFDVITDFGTLEHVFNIGAGFEFIHDHLEVGGLALHVLPTRGDYNHGFYNIHATFYEALCAANGYDIVDIAYVPDFAGQCLRRDTAGPHGRTLILDAAGIDQARRELDYADAVRARAPQAPAIFDYMFVAYRKTADRAFAYPLQGIYPDMAKIRDFAGTEFHQILRRFEARLGAAHGYLEAGRWPEADALIAEALALAAHYQSMAYARERLCAVYQAAAATHVAARRADAVERLARAALALVPDDPTALRLLDQAALPR